MSPPNVPRSLEPGTRLVDRYLLVEAVTQSDGMTYWRAQDELLDRAVGVLVMADGSSRGTAVLQAAQQAAALADPRFLRLLDAAETDGLVYVVSEWVVASDLAELVAEQPLPSDQARDLVADLAGALESAHAHGLAHLCLTPEHVLCTAQGQLKIAGLGVDAAAHGISASAEEAVVRDTRGAAAILYAALTTRWPGEHASRLAPAPYDGDHLCSPRQVRAGVPDDLDSIAARVLDLGHSPGAPLTTPGELARGLIATATTGRMPALEYGTRLQPAIRDGAADPGSGYAPYPSYGEEAADGSGRGRLAGRTAFLLVGLAMLVGVGLIAWQLRTLDLVPDGSSGPSPSPSGAAAAPSRPIPIVSGATLDPPPAGNGDENSDRAALAYDDSTSTSWTTKTYDQQFGPGGLKDGVGLVLDLGSKQPVSSLRLILVGPADLQVRVADQQGSALDDYTRVGAATDADGRVVVHLDRSTRARYVLLWLTRLPPASDGGFRGDVADVSVRG